MLQWNFMLGWALFFIVFPGFYLLLFAINEVATAEQRNTRGAQFAPG